MIRHKRFLTIFTMIIAFSVCCILLFYSGYSISNQNKIVYQESYNSGLFLLVIATFWIVGFLCYKIFTLEDKINELQNAENTNRELLNHIIKQNELDFVSLQEFSQNTREMFLRIYYDNKSKELNKGEQE